MQLIPTFSRFWLCTSPDRVGRFIPSLHLVGWWPWNPKPMSNIVQSPEETWRNPPLGPLWHYVLDRTPPSDHLVSFGPSGQPNHSRSSRQFGAPGPFQSFFSQEPWPWHGLKVSSFWHGEIDMYSYYIIKSHIYIIYVILLQIRFRYQEMNMMNWNCLMILMGMLHWRRWSLG